MLDQFHRDIHYLRISVTDRCNLRCIYCMPEQGIRWIDHSEILSYEQITRSVKQFAALGITHVRLTGGEPLVRPHLYRLVSGLRSIPGISGICLTTNGILLADQLPGLVDSSIPCSQDEARSLLANTFGQPLPCDPPPGSGPSQYVRFPGFIGRIGFISAISHQFCSQCNRVLVSCRRFENLSAI